MENVERLKWVLDSEHLKSRGKSISISTLKQLNFTIFSQKCKLLMKLGIFFGCSALCKVGVKKTNLYTTMLPLLRLGGRHVSYCIVFCIIVFL